MKSRIKSSWFLSGLLVLLTATTLFANGLSIDEKNWLEKGFRYEKNGWIYVHIEGQPYERGFQHGYLLAKEIQVLSMQAKILRHHQTQ